MGEVPDLLVAGVEAIAESLFGADGAARVEMQVPAVLGSRFDGELVERIPRRTLRYVVHRSAG